MIDLLTDCLNLRLELPINSYLDTDLKVWKDLGLVSWPSVLLCTNPSFLEGGSSGGNGGSSSGGSEGGKVVFMLEAQRALTPVAGNAIAAVATALATMSMSMKGIRHATNDLT